AAGLQHRVVTDDEIGRVGQAEPDLHARPHPQRLEPLRRALGQPPDLGIAVALAQELDAGPLGKARDGVVEQAFPQLFARGPPPTTISRGGSPPGKTPPLPPPPPPPGR